MNLVNITNGNCYCLYLSLQAFGESLSDSLDSLSLLSESSVVLPFGNNQVKGCATIYNYCIFFQLFNIYIHLNIFIQQIFIGHMLIFMLWIRF